MRRRWLRWSLWTLLLAVDLYLYLPWPSRVTRENYDRIQVGMTEAEVVATLGPPGDYRNSDNEYDDAPAHQPAPRFGRGNPTERLRFWKGDAADVALGFVVGKGGTLRVSNGIFCYMRAKSDNPLRNLPWRAKHRLGASSP
jgi:hypothetical protein